MWWSVFYQSAYMWDQKNEQQKQTHKKREQIGGYQSGEALGAMGEVGYWD